MLKLENIVAKYGRVEALKGISLEVRLGELVTLIGSNGAGKSTTIKIISGLLKPESGQVILEGAKTTGLPPYQMVKRGVGLSPEERHVFPKLTVEENLQMGAYIRKDKKVVLQEMDRVFDLFPRLKERYNQLAGSLSGGEQQMLAIGRALMCGPRLLLLDEPSLGLAPIVVENMAEIILELKKTGLSILLVEQNANVALRIADRGYLMDTGTIVLEGNAGELLNDDRVRQIYLGQHGEEECQKA
ncbi:MAG: ABC transporter ATP-binding protein [Desulfosporosinus sp. BRH_c37]|nr:MAG: ABC transporter ATP-binding protein [Desulfosporosinus sp. BRH_c37]